MNIHNSHIQLSYTSIAAEEFHSLLANAFDCKSENGPALVSSEIGDGTFFLKQIDNGFHFFSLDVLSKSDLIFNKQLIYQANGNKSFTISYLLTEDVRFVKDTITNTQIPFKKGSDVMVASDESGFRLEIPAGKRMKIVSINISEQWMQREFADSIEFSDQLMKKLCYGAIPKICVEKADVQELILLSEINEQAFFDPTNEFSIKAKLFSLVSQFFLNQSEKHEIVCSDIKNLHTEKMMEVEKILQAHVEKKLPALTWIAKKMMLSVSTLKRHFKIVFGKNIYEYYLELKMEHAKRLLMENPISVNEVASKLEYGKVSSFIGIFKKHFGVCPGGIKRKYA